MRICGQLFNSTLLSSIQSMVNQESQISRRALSRHVCELLNWRSPNGKLQEGGCRKALIKLHRKGLIQLPAIEHTYSFEHTISSELTVEIPEILCSLQELGEIEVVAITNRKSHDAQVWKSLISRYHYLGNAKMCGGQIRYLIKNAKYGYLGALSFNSGLLALRDRDKYIGWSEAARRANIGRVVLNSRFLILPSVHVQNLASHVLALTLRRLQQDWESRYNVIPVLVETFVDPTHFDGACYKAANWIGVGSSAGRFDGVKKDIYLYPLSPDWKGILGKEPALRFGEIPRIESPLSWAEEEFGTCRLPDNRLRERLVNIAENFYNRPVANIPEACSGSAAVIKGAYRFFNNKKITMDVILTPHIESTIERIKKYATVLAPQDTTTLNYSHPATVGLGPTGSNSDNSVGMQLHDTLAFSEDGTPLGVLDAQCWARDPEDRNKSKRRKDVPIEEKESIKWLRSFRKLSEIQKLCPDTMLVSIGDRESDVYELFVEASKDSAGPKLLVRSDRHRNRKVQQLDDEQEEYEYLWTFMEQQSLSGTLNVHIPKREGVKARDAIVDVKFSRIKINPPKDTKHTPLENFWAVYLIESDNADVESRIEWMLLTTVETATFEDAKKRSEWYAGRWGIEVYHRTLKSGCRILNRQLGTAESLQACLGVDMVVAWRIYHLTMLGREVPDHPCSVFFEDVEWKALCCHAEKTPVAPTQPPTLVEAIRMVGKLGGHIGRKGDGMPGTECIWRGLQHLDMAVEMYVIFTGNQLPEIRKSYPEALTYNAGFT
jgi:hypothetical protein